MTSVRATRGPGSRAANPAYLAATVLWALGVSVGMHLLWRYKFTPGPAATAPADWPAGSAIARAPGRSTLVMVVHPLCVCTRASVGELAEVMARVGDRVDAHVLFSMPVRGGDDPAGWTRGDAWRSVAAIPGVHVHADPGGAEAARFGGVTSGHTVAYDAAGRRLFSGGITGSRGHAGDNPGRERLTALLRGERADEPTSPVFGCRIDDLARAAPAAEASQ